MGVHVVFSCMRYVKVVVVGMIILLCCRVCVWCGVCVCVCVCVCGVRGYVCANQTNQEAFTNNSTYTDMESHCPGSHH